MGMLLMCSTCCMCLSIWAVVQLGIMGVLYNIKALLLLEDVHAHDGEYTDYDDFIKITKENYASAAINCWITAALYLVTLGLSLIGLYHAKKAEKKEAVRREDDEYSCQPKEEKKEKKKCCKRK